MGVEANDIDIIDTLLKNEALINHQDKEGNTALHIAF